MQTTANSNQGVNSGWWLAYYLVMLVVWAVSTIIGDHDLFALVRGVFFGFGLIGMWGFIRGIAIGWQPFWAVYFCLVVAGVVYSIGSLAFEPDAPWPLSLWLVVLASAIFTFPQWWSLWRYAFRSRGIWRGFTTEA